MMKGTFVGAPVSVAMENVAGLAATKNAPRRSVEKKTIRVNLPTTAALTLSVVETAVTRFASRVVMKSTMNAATTTIAAPTSNVEGRTERSSV